MNQRLKEYYDEMLEYYGPDDARALAWRDKKSQQLRFNILSEIADLSSTSILDEGCGLGDLYPFLTERFQTISYTGIDINAQLIAAAQKKYPAATFEVADFAAYPDTPFDYVLASGTLTFKIPDYREVYFAHITKMFHIARKGIAFNMLNAHSFAGNDLYATYDPHEIENFCRTLTLQLNVRQDYSKEDFTIYLYH